MGGDLCQTDYLNFKLKKFDGECFFSYICTMKILLDDIRTPYDVFKNTVDFEYYKNEDWVIIKTYEDFVIHIEEHGIPDIVSFDHDLTYEHYLSENQKNIDYDAMKVKTGYHAATWLIEYCKNKNLKLPKVKVHSQNPEGKKNILGLFF